MPRLNKNRGLKITLFSLLLLILSVFVMQVNGAWIKVRLVMLAVDPPSVGFDPIAADVKFASPESCLGADFNPDLVAKGLLCWKGKMKASILSQKIVDIKSGIERMKLMLSSLERTRIYVESAKNENNLNLWAIPAGLSVEKKYDKADTVTVQCLKDRDGHVISATAATGVLIGEPGPFFDSAPKSQLDKIIKIKKENRAQGTEIVTLMNSGKEIGTVKGILIGKNLQGMQQELAKVTIPVTEAEISTYYPEFQNNPQATMGVLVTLKTENEQRITPSWASGEKTQKIMGIFGVTPPLYSCSMNIDGFVYDFKDMVIPYNYAIAEAKKAISEHKKRLTDLKATYEALLQKLQKSYNELEAAGFNCA